MAGSYPGAVPKIIGIGKNESGVAKGRVLKALRSVKMSLTVLVPRKLTIIMLLSLFTAILPPTPSLSPNSLTVTVLTKLEQTDGVLLIHSWLPSALSVACGQYAAAAYWTMNLNAAVTSVVWPSDMRPIFVSQFWRL